MVEWEEIAVAFRAFHKSPVNVALHLITSPLAILGASACAAHYVPAAWVIGIHALWIVSLLPTVPFRLWVASAVLHAAVAAASLYAAASGLLGPLVAALLFAAAYVSQDLAHFLTWEATYQSSYQGKSDGWMWILLAHTHHLVPLCLDACWHTQHGSLAALFAQRKQVSFVNLNSKNLPKLRRAMETVGAWALAQKPREDQTTHWWPRDIGDAAEQAFYTVARSQELMTQLFEPLFPSETHVVEPLEGMNEVYVAVKGHKNGNSDTVFYMNHVDGPYGVFPLVHVYRCMCACTHNEQIETIFPLAGGRTHYTLTTGDIAGFDFNRELHHINLVPPERGGKENKDARVCMKVHYLVYPKALKPLGKLLGRITTHYNTNFRKLFLSTIDPNSLYSRVMAVFVLLGTRIFNSFESVVGWGNIPVLGAFAALALLARSYAVFFYCTSFTHYAIYLSTYHTSRRNKGVSSNAVFGVAFGAFKRDALLYKSLALAQAAAQYVYRFDFASPDYGSIALLVGGFGMATLAAHRLGVDRTYFGWELGECSGEFVQRFPYGTVPHPMILGGCVGWMGFFKLAGFRAAWPSYAPLHVLCYIVHATQEHLAIHSTGQLAQSDGDKPKVQ